MAPYGIFSGEAVPYSADLALTSPYCDFIQNNRFPYENIRLLNPRVGLVYSFPSNFFTHYSYLRSFYGAGYALLDSQIQHDVIFCGDEFMLQDSSSLEQLSKYDVIILPDARNLSDAQVQRVLDYVYSGGTTVAWGEIGAADERNRLPDESQRMQLRTLATPGSHAFG